jgi:hypothetical protein
MYKNAAMHIISVAILHNQRWWWVTEVKKTENIVPAAMYVAQNTQRNTSTWTDRGGLRKFTKILK